MRNKRYKEFNRKERMLPVKNYLAIDLAKSKSMLTLISSCGEVLIEPYEINHSINDFSNLFNRINNFKLNSVSVIIESTGVYTN